MTGFARLGLAAMLALPAVSCAQDRPSTGDPAARDEHGPNREELRRTQDRRNGRVSATRRLETVTWNSVKHELTWEISKGQKAVEGYKPGDTANYMINMDDATMTFSGQTRRFSKEEAANVHVLMDLIAKYAVDSTVWWDEGKGEPVDGKGKPTGKENVSVLHVAFRPAPGDATSSQSIEQQIHQLERRLALLKQMDSMLKSLESSPMRPAVY